MRRASALPKLCKMNTTISSTTTQDVYKRQELNVARRTLWVVSPISKKVESKKVYNRKKSARLYRDDTGRIFDIVMAE